MLQMITPLSLLLATPSNSGKILPKRSDGIPCNRCLCARDELGGPPLNIFSLGFLVFGKAGRVQKFLLANDGFL